jgi:hypothetical protein
MGPHGGRGGKLVAQALLEAVGPNAEYAPWGLTATVAGGELMSEV